MSKTVKFDLNEYKEYTDNIDAPDNVFLHNEIGNTKLIRIYNNENKNLKIQFVLKIQDDYNNNIIDHLFEIIIVCDDEVIGMMKKTDKFDIINVSLNNSINTDINIQNIKGLITDNFNAYNNRLQLLEPSYYSNVINYKIENLQHKPINHIGRLLYLLFLFKNMKNNDYIKRNINTFCVDFMSSLKLFIHKNRNKKIDVLKYFIIKKPNYYEYDIIDIKIIDIIKAFIDVFYIISSNGVMTKRVITMNDIYLFNNKNINDVFKDDIFFKQYNFDENKPLLNSQYNDINNIVNENNFFSKLKNLITEFKIKHGKPIKISKSRYNSTYKVKPKSNSLYNSILNKKNKSIMRKKPYSSI
jgi:hypothetical protein